MESVLNKFEAFLLTERCLSVNTFHAYMNDMHQFLEFLKTENIALNNVELSHLKSFLKFLKTAAAKKLT